MLAYIPYMDPMGYHQRWIRQVSLRNSACESRRSRMVTAWWSNFSWISASLGPDQVRKTLNGEIKNGDAVGKGFRLLKWRLFCFYGKTLNSMDLNEVCPYPSRTSWNSTWMMFEVFCFDQLFVRKIPSIVKSKKHPNHSWKSSCKGQTAMDDARKYRLNSPTKMAKSFHSILQQTVTFRKGTKINDLLLVTASCSADKHQKKGQGPQRLWQSSISSVQLWSKVIALYLHTSGSWHFIHFH